MLHVLHVVHEIINTLGVFIPLINWEAVISLIDSGLQVVSNWLNYKTACKNAEAKMYQPPVHSNSRRRNPRQQTMVRRRRKHSSSI